VVRGRPHPIAGRAPEHVTMPGVLIGQEMRRFYEEDNP